LDEIRQFDAERLAQYRGAVKIKTGIKVPYYKWLNRRISTKNHPILTKFGTQQHCWNMELGDSQI